MTSDRTEADLCFISHHWVKLKPVKAIGVKRLSLFTVDIGYIHISTSTTATNPAILCAPQLDSSHAVKAPSVLLTVRSLHRIPPHSRLTRALTPLHAVQFPFSRTRSVDTPFITSVRGSLSLQSPGAGPLQEQHRTTVACSPPMMPTRPTTSPTVRWPITTLCCTAAEPQLPKLTTQDDAQSNFSQLCRYLTHADSSGQYLASIPKTATFIRAQ